MMETDGRLGLEMGLPKLEMYAPDFRARHKKTLREAAEIIADAKARGEEIVAAARREANAVLAAARRGESEAAVTILAAGPREKVARIIEVTARAHGLRVADLLGPGRDQRTVAARHEAMARTHVLRPDLSLPQLGRHFGRDHTSVLHALRKAGLRRSRDGGDAA